MYRHSSSLGNRGFKVCLGAKLFIKIRHFEAGGLANQSLMFPAPLDPLLSRVYMTSALQKRRQIRIDLTVGKFNVLNVASRTSYRNRKLFYRSRILLRWVPTRHIQGYHMVMYFPSNYMYSYNIVSHVTKKPPKYMYQQVIFHSRLSQICLPPTQSVHFDPKQYLAIF